jgi:hypothetical protein
MGPNFEILHIWKVYKKIIFHPILKFFFFEIVVDGFPLSPMDSEQNLTERGQNLNFLIFHLTLMHFISFFFCKMFILTYLSVNKQNELNIIFFEKRLKGIEILHIWKI